MQSGTRIACGLRAAIEQVASVGREIIAPIHASVASCATPSRRGLEARTPYPRRNGQPVTASRHEAIGKSWDAMTPCADAVKAGRRAGDAARSAVARPRLDGGEHGVMLAAVGPGRVLL